jgi:hypothetical protein
MIDAGMVVYAGLLALGIWRYMSMWRLCGNALVWANYCVLGYMFFFVLLVSALWTFISATLSSGGKAAWGMLPNWMHPFVLGAPVAACISYALNAAQTLQHVNEIRLNKAVLKHDRVVQIIALPAVYGVMAMSSLARMYEFLTVQQHTAIRGFHGNASLVPPREEDTELEQLFISKSETCFWVGDLYEAWALYLFGLLTLDLIKESLNRRLQGTDTERHEAVVAYVAVEKIAWLGVTLFLVFCIVQAGWALYLLTFTDTTYDLFNTRMSQFKAAGMVASVGAIYNVHTVESTFHLELENYRPLLKFITVKIIVSFAFFQRQTITVLSEIQDTLPGMVQSIVKALPILGDLIEMSDVHFELFYDALILYECILISALHWYGWSPYEEWYLNSPDEDENKPLMGYSGEPPTNPFTPASGSTIV